MRIPKPNLYKILLYYSTFLSTILIIGGLYNSRSTREIVSNLLFLPIVVFLWVTLIQKRREAKRINTKEKMNKKIKSYRIKAKTRNESQIRR